MSFTCIFTGCNLNSVNDKGLLEIANISGRRVIDMNSDWNFYLETLESKDGSSYTVDNFKQI